MSDSRKLYRVTVTHFGYVFAHDEYEAGDLETDIVSEEPSERVEVVEVEPGTPIEHCDWALDQPVFNSEYETILIRDAWPKGESDA